jgi:hypothetical protein
MTTLAPIDLMFLHALQSCLKLGEVKKTIDARYQLFNAQQVIDCALEGTGTFAKVIPIESLIEKIEMSKIVLEETYANSESVENLNVEQELKNNTWMVLEKETLSDQTIVVADVAIVGEKSTIRKRTRVAIKGQEKI